MVEKRVGTVKAFGVSRRGGANSENLGCSSNYTSENLVDRSGEGFRINCIGMRVKRS